MIAAFPAAAHSDQDGAVEHQSVSRRCLLHLPPGAADDGPRPLVLALQGLDRGGDSGQAMRWFRTHWTMDAVTRRDGFAVVHPEAVAGRWNYGTERPIILLLTGGQMNGHEGAALILPTRPPARQLIADRGYDSDRFRAAWIQRGIEARVPFTKSREYRLRCDRALYRQRHCIENSFGRIKAWRRVATRYDRCAHAFFSAICIAATITFRL